MKPIAIVLLSLFLFLIVVVPLAIVIYRRIVDKRVNSVKLASLKLAYLTELNNKTKIDTNYCHAIEREPVFYSKKELDRYDGRYLIN